MCLSFNVPERLSLDKLKLTILKARNMSNVDCKCQRLKKKTPKHCCAIIFKFLSQEVAQLFLHCGPFLGLCTQFNGNLSKPDRTPLQRSEFATVLGTPDSISRLSEKYQPNVKKMKASKVDSTYIVLDTDNLATLSTSFKAVLPCSTETPSTQETDKAGSPVPDNNTPIISNSSCTRIKGKSKWLEQRSNDNSLNISQHGPNQQDTSKDRQPDVIHDPLSPKDDFSNPGTCVFTYAWILNTRSHPKFLIDQSPTTTIANNLPCLIRAITTVFWLRLIIILHCTTITGS
ncbi:unnamed protein product, partial [Dicrocoelium dendriticum]